MTLSLRLSRSCERSTDPSDRSCYTRSSMRTSGSVGYLVGPGLENCRYDRVFLTGPPTRLVGGYLMLTISTDRPCVWIHVVHEQFFL